MSLSVIKAHDTCHDNAFLHLLYNMIRIYPDVTYSSLMTRLQAAITNLQRIRSLVLVVDKISFIEIGAEKCITLL